MSDASLRIALPNKGRLVDDVRELFDDAGLPARFAGDRALSASLGGVFEAIFVRAQDIPEFVADGAADAGITGWDLISESQRELESLCDLEIGRCRLVVAARDDSGIECISAIPAGARVATSFPRLTQRFFAEQDRRIDVVPVSGAAEIAPHLGIADVIVDLVSTGSTLRSNGLREIATVLDSSARLVAAPNDVRKSSGLEPGGRERALSELVAALTSVLRARDKRYLMANVPKRALSRVREILPGLNGPTIVDIMNGGEHVAVHAVVAASGIYRTIAQLKDLGAEGILVTRIERLMP